MSEYMSHGVTIDYMWVFWECIYDGSLDCYGIS